MNDIDVMTQARNGGVFRIREETPSILLINNPLFRIYGVAVAVDDGYAAQADWSHGCLQMHRRP